MDKPITPDFINEILKIKEKDEGKIYGSMDDFLKSLEE